MTERTLIKVATDLFQWTSTCNSYVWRRGDRAVLFDFGDGSVLEALPGIGVSKVDWVLFTHHHREQCQNAEKLTVWRRQGTRVAAPEAERELFEKPRAFRYWRPTLHDRYTVYGASYVRPPVTAVPIDRGLKKMDVLEWAGQEIWCIDTAGHSPGHMAYLFRGADGRWLGVSGDLMLDGACLHTWFDSEWDYGFGAGIYALANAAAQVTGYDPTLLLPAHGPLIRNARGQLIEFVEKLKRLEAHYLRGYSIKRFANCDQDTVSRPSAVPHVWQVTPHLFKFRGPDYWVNFAIIIAAGGRGLVIDCGLFDRAFLDKAIEGMKQRLGLQGIDAVFVTHMHGDHALEADYLRRQYGAKLWTLDLVADKFKRPWDTDLAALLPFYTDRNRDDIATPLSFDRVFQNGDSFNWEGYKFTVDWMPGQTKFHACLHGAIDGRKVAFCGDNIFASTTDPSQGGNECVLARNGGTLEEGYLYAASYLHSLRPDLIIGGHCWVMDKPHDLVERYRRRMIELRDAFQALSREPDYRIIFDPYWVCVNPYRVAVKRGGETRVTLEARSYWPQVESFRMTFAPPEGITVHPAALELRIGPGRTSDAPLHVRCGPDIEPGTYFVGIDVTVGDRPFGQWFDFIVHVET